MWITLLTLACQEPAPVTPITQCAGPYAGGFEGDVEGEVSAELDEEGRLIVSFDTPEGELVAAGGVLDDGSLSESTGGVDVDGRFDFDLCEADGDWVADKWEGTWSIARTGHSAANRPRSWLLRSSRTEVRFLAGSWRPESGLLR